MDNDLDSVRVLTRSQTLRAAGVSERTWERLEAKGDVPPKTQLSEGRIGYRILDINEWLDSAASGPRHDRRRRRQTSRLPPASCGSHRQSASNEAYQFISSTIAAFGRLAEPVIVRNRSAAPLTVEAPATANATASQQELTRHA